MKKLITVLAFAGTFAFQHTIAQTITPDTAIINFVNKAAKGGMTEVNSGKLALKKGKSASVKAFGARMIADHSKANAKLKAIVAAKRWRIAAPSATEVQPDAMLTGSTGAEFDRSYINMMVKDHKKTVQLFERAAKQSPDAQIKAFATQTLPTLKQHYTSIQSIADKLGIAYDK
jgi:putative membrane protein